MKYELKKSSIGNPLGIFEHMFTHNGQLILKGDFLSKYDTEQYYQNFDEHEKYHEWKFDLEKDSLTWYYQISEGDYESEEKFYINFLKDYFQREYRRSIVLFEDRLNECNDLTDLYFVLYSLRRKIKRFKDYVGDSPILPHRNKQLEWIKKIEKGLVSKYESYTGYLSEMSLDVKKIREIVGRLIIQLDLTKDPKDLDNILYFVCSNNMNENFGFINCGCIVWTLKEIIRKFQAYGYLSFSDTDIVKTEFFRRNGNPISIETWQNSKSTNELKKREITIAIHEAFEPKKNKTI